jgi:hypothetical protein
MRRNNEKKKQPKNSWPLFPIPKDAELYVAICSIIPKSFFKKLKIHSFIMVGVRHKKSGNPIFCGVGKIVFNNKKIILWDELRHWLTKPKEKEFSYKAFSINLEQYHQFLMLLGECAPLAPYLGAYIPCHNIQTDLLDWSYQKLEKEETQYELSNDPKLEKMKSRTKEMSLSNTCRHTAIELLNIILNPGQKNQDISSLWFKKLPFTGRVREGKMCGSLFILPSPPSIDGLSKQQYKALSIMYAQLEQIPKKYKDKADTWRKFKNLKNLYVKASKKIGSHREQEDLTRLLNIINHWETKNHNKNQKLVDQHRRRFFIFGKTATRKMLDKIKKIKPKIK